MAEIVITSHVAAFLLVPGAGNCIVTLLDLWEQDVNFIPMEETPVNSNSVPCDIFRNHENQKSVKRYTFC